MFHGEAFKPSFMPEHTIMLQRLSRCLRVTREKPCLLPQKQTVLCRATGVHCIATGI